MYDFCLFWAEFVFQTQNSCWSVCRYGLLGKMVTLPGAQGTAAMLALDQFAFAPAFVASFMSSVCALEVRICE